MAIAPHLGSVKRKGAGPMRRERILDEYLVAAARTGDAQAFDLLVARWQPRLVAHAVRLTSHRDGAQDVVQESWLEIARGLGRLRDERAFPAWAYRIASRRCAAMINRLQRDRLIGTALEVSADDQGPLDALESASDSDRLRAAVRALPPEQRAAVALFHFEELSVAEVSVALDVPVGTIKTRLMHARRKLRAVLEGE
jgi:RNA polymerase sigma-70 factor (ECF subfamily)